MNKLIKIGTHSGCFHADEALACFMLKKLPEYADADIVRTRDAKILDTCDVVVDVGGVYNPSKHRYDHHQSSFNETIQTLRPELKCLVRLSSAGLIYHHFGERVFEVILKKKLNNPFMRKIFSYVYFNFMDEIDAVDNGVPMHTEGEPLYSYHTSLSSRVKRLHPPWNAKTEVDMDELFKTAMEMTGKEFTDRVLYFNDVSWPAWTSVQEAIDNRFQFHTSGEIIVVPSSPWQSPFFDIEKEQNMEGVIKYVIFSDSDSWRVRAVPLSPGNFVSRLALHTAWRGLRDQELQEKSGVSDAVFVHNTGFIGGALSREGAIALAAKTLAHNQ